METGFEVNHLSLECKIYGFIDRVKTSQTIVNIVDMDYTICCLRVLRLEVIRVYEVCCSGQVTPIVATLVAYV